MARFQKGIVDLLELLLQRQDAVAPGDAGQLDDLVDQLLGVALLVDEGQLGHLQATDEIGHGERDRAGTERAAQNDHGGGQLNQRSDVTTLDSLDR